MMDCFDLHKQVAIVTGASKGLGFTFSKALAKAGAALFIIARDEEQLREKSQIIRELGVPCEWYKADITNEQEISRAIETCLDKFGKVDILINNAACGRINVPPEDHTLEDWKFVIDTNLTGMFICAKAVGQQMIKQGSGKIINIASMSGLIINKGVYGGSYEVSKHGVIGLTRALAVEWAKYNINVNALAPGYIMTKLNKDFFETAPEVLDQFIELTPAHRIGEPEDLEGVIIFLASKASDFMYGSVIIIDGGYTCW